jgi:hypothetical protein
MTDRSWTWLAPALMVMLVCREHTEECWAKNRRAHFLVKAQQRGAAGA